MKVNSTTVYEWRARAVAAGAGGERPTPSTAHPGWLPPLLLATRWRTSAAASSRSHLLWEQHQTLVCLRSSPSVVHQNVALAHAAAQCQQVALTRTQALMTEAVDPAWRHCRQHIEQMPEVQFNPSLRLVVASGASATPPAARAATAWPRLAHTTLRAH
jgi:hypothetical protein